MKKVLLAVLALSSSVLAHSQCTELFFSEIDEGSGNNKAFEVYNPTSSPINLSNYRIIRFSNGSTVPTDSLTLTGTIPAHGVWVVVNGQTTSTPSSPACDTALQAMADQLGGVYPDPCYQNGDDAIVLAKIAPRTFVDIFGKIGEDPGSSWSDVFPYTDAQGTWWTKDHSLIRKSSVTAGVIANPSAFNVTTEWDSLTINDWSNLGMHTSTCSSSGVHESIKNAASISTYPNPSNGTFTVNAVAEIKTVEVYNALGALVFSKVYSTSENEQQIDLSGQPSGLYLMQVQLSTGKRAVSKVSIR